MPLVSPDTGTCLSVHHGRGCNPRPTRVCADTHKYPSPVADGAFGLPAQPGFCCVPPSFVYDFDQRSCVDRMSLPSVGDNASWFNLTGAHHACGLLTARSRRSTVIRARPGCCYDLVQSALHRRRSDSPSASYFCILHAWSFCASTSHQHVGICICRAAILIVCRCIAWCFRALFALLTCAFPLAQCCLP